MSLFGIAQHLGHLVVGSNDRETAVCLGIKHIVGRCGFRFATGPGHLLPLQLLALQHLLGFLQGLLLCYLSCQHSHAAETTHTQ